MPTTQAPTPDPKAPAPTTPQPTAIGDWQLPRLPQPFDVVRVVETGGGGGGGGGANPSNSPPTMDGASSAGSSPLFARGDHRHPSDTSRQAALVSGTNIKTVNGESLLGSGDVAVTGGGGGPNPSTSAPTMNAGTTGAPGSAALYSRGDHVHPSDTSRLALAGGSLSNFLTLHAAPTAANHAATKAYVDAVTTALTALTARVVALESAGPPSAPVISSPLTYTGQVGVAFSYTIVAPGATSFNATNLPGGLTRTGATISGTPTTEVTDHPITISATNTQGTDTKTLEVTIGPAAAGWEVQFSFSNSIVNVNGLNIGGVGFPPNGRIPLVEWTGWQAAYAADVTDDLYDVASQAAMPVKLMAKYTGLPDQDVPFDNWTNANPPANQLKEWGYDDTTKSILVTGGNATGSPIAMRLVKV